MARPSRILPAGIPAHIIRRGKNRQICFAAEKDYQAYAGWHAHYAKKHVVDVQAWVMMPNHVRVLCTPRQEDSLSLMMQSLGR